MGCNRDGKSVRMAHLASVGCHTINGVAELHTSLLKRDVLHDFYELWPDKFVSVTNGVTPRRWMMLANPSLAKLITEAIGDRWVQDANELRQRAMHYRQLAETAREEAVAMALLELAAEYDTLADRLDDEPTPRATQQ